MFLVYVYIIIKRENQLCRSNKVSFVIEKYVIKIRVFDNSKVDFDNFL